MRHFQRCGLVGSIAAVIGVLCVGIPARADEGVIGFTTFLREGPSLRYRVVDEVATGQAVEVGDCADGWCRVMQDRATGFVPQAVLVVPRAVRKLIDGTCFLNRGNGARGGTQEQFCYDASSKR